MKDQCWHCTTGKGTTCLHYTGSSLYRPAMPDAAWLPTRDETDRQKKKLQIRIQIIVLVVIVFSFFFFSRQLHRRHSKGADWRTINMLLTFNPTASFRFR